MSNKQNNQPHKMPSVGLDESPLSAYAKAVNEVGRHNKQSNILMGYAPPLLRWLTTINNHSTYTSHPILYKDMKGKHRISAKNMLQVPYQLNNPVAILGSSPNATQQGFVFVTDLQEYGKPIIIAMHRVILSTSSTTLFMPTVYENELRFFQNKLNHAVLCWNYGRAEKFEKMWDGILDLPKHIYPTQDFGKQQRGVFSTDTALDNPTPHSVVSSLSYNTSPLFVDYDRTERYLSQYFSDLSVNPNLYLDENQVNEVRKWTQQHAPMTFNEAEQVLLPVYAQFMPSDNVALQVMQQQVITELKTIYDPRNFITGEDLPAFYQKAQQFAKEYQEKQPLSKEKALSALNDIAAEFYTGAEYQSCIALNQQRVEEIYAAGKSITMQNIHQARNNHKERQQQIHNPPEQSKDKGERER